MAAYIDKILMLMAGIYITAIGFGYVAPPGTDPIKREEWLRRFQPIFKVIGPLMVIIFLVLALGEAVRHAAS